MKPDALLAAMEAPEGLVEWARERGEPESAGRARGASDRAFEDTWDSCPRADWQVWLAGAAALPLSDLVLVLVAWGGEVLADVPEAESIALHVLDLAERTVQREATRAECLVAAEDAEHAARDAPVTFRDSPPLGYGAMASAASWIARAAEGLMTANLRAEAARMQRAQRSASYLGGGPQIFLEREQPVVLAAERLPDDPFHSELLYVVASAAEGAAALARAMAETHDREADAPAPLAELLVASHTRGAARIRALFRE